jgi:hypothetical protein
MKKKTLPREKLRTLRRENVHHIFFKSPVLYVFLMELIKADRSGVESLAQRRSVCVPV